MRKTLVALVLVVALVAIVPAGALRKAKGTHGPMTVKLLERGTSIVDHSTGRIVWEVLQGHATHLGRTREVVTGKLIPTGADTFNVDLAIEITASNGGTLRGTCTGSGETTFASGGTTAEGEWTCRLRGGTGRYAHARGTATVNVHIVRQYLDGLVGYYDIYVRASGRLSY